MTGNENVSITDVLMNTLIGLHEKKITQSQVDDVVKVTNNILSDINNRINQHKEKTK